MARAGVTYLDIVKAANSVKGLGQEPTVDRIREQLGTGSKSTIAPLLKRWREESGSTANTDGLPVDLVDVVKALYNRMQQSADLRIEQSRDEFTSLNDALQQQLTTLNQANSQAKAHQIELTREIERLHAENKQLTESTQEMRIILVKTESQRDDLAERNNELKQAVLESKQENRDIREHFEHYQQRSAEDRQQERDQYRLTNQQLVDQIQELRALLSEKSTEVSTLANTSTRLQEYSLELKQTNERISSELGLKTETISNLEREIEKIAQERQSYRDDNERLAEKMLSLTNQKASVEKEMALLSQALEIAQTELTRARDKVELLSDENKFILQEKAVIHGQFKQLLERN